MAVSIWCGVSGAKCLVRAYGIRTSEDKIRDEVRIVILETRYSQDARRKTSNATREYPRRPVSGARHERRRIPYSQI